MLQVTCPSGMKGELREILVADEDMLAAESGGASVAAGMARIENLVKACFVRVIDAGPYPHLSELDDRILAADLTYLLVRLRGHSWGDELDVTATCPNGHHVAGRVKCSEAKKIELDKEVAARFKRGEPEEFVLPSSGRKVRFWLLTRAIEKSQREAREMFPKEQATQALAARIESIEGFDNAAGIDTETQLGMPEWLRQQPSRDAMALRARFGEVDAGVDTAVEIACPEVGCGQIAETDLLLNADFFVPAGGRN